MNQVNRSFAVNSVPRNFLSSIWKTRRYRRYLWVALAGVTVQFIIFKLLYPFPDFISDSYSYIETNLNHMSVNLWPVGYSRYLALIHSLTSSDTFLIFTQYYSLVICLLYLFFTLLHLYQLPEKYVILIFLFFFFNPLLLYLSNCVLSDSLFCSLSILWFAQMLWMIERAKPYHILVLSILIGLLFIIRYTAIYYPLVTALAFLLSKQRIWMKLVGILSPFALIIPFIIYTQQKTKEITGTAQFSVFGGWQILNNALYMYDHIDVDNTKIPQNALVLDSMVRRYFKDIPPAYRRLESFPGTYFIKMRHAPLKEYMLQRYKIHDAPSEFYAWGKVSPMYNDYGVYLIKNYPIPFLKYYIWLNVKNYMVPHMEKFGNYNLEMDKVFPGAQVWFKYKSRNIKVISKDLQGKITFWGPSLFLFLNVIFIGCLFYLLIVYRFQLQHICNIQALLLVCAFFLFNFIFSAFATPVVLRYQIFPMVLFVPYTLFLLHESEKRSLENETIKRKEDRNKSTGGHLILNN